jgi:pilus assembly protein CpaE
MSRFNVITTVPEFERRVRSAASGTLTGTVQSIPSVPFPVGPEEILARQTGEPLEVIVVGPGVPLDKAIKLASVFDLMYPEISVLLVHETTEALALQAMRSGVRDLLSPDADIDTIRVMLERASLASASRRRGLTPAHEPERQQGRVIAVMSPKGGVGKTTVSTNLAIGLAKLAPMSVVLVDFDVQFGDVASGLQLSPEHTLSDAVNGAAANDSMVLKAYLTVHPSGVYVLAAPSSPTDSEHISGEQVARVLAQLASEFAFVVVDSSPGLGEHVIATLEQATDAVWVCGMDIPSIKGLRAALGVLHEINLVPPGRHVVLNFADRFSGLRVQDVEDTLGIPVDVVLPRSRSIPLSTNRGVPLLQDNVRDAATKGLRKLVSRFDPKVLAQPQKKVHRRVVIS